MSSIKCIDDSTCAVEQGLEMDTPFLLPLLRHSFEAADRRHSESLDEESFATFVDAVIYFHRNWDRFQYVL